MNHYILSKELLNYIKNLQLDQTLNNWKFKGQTDIAYSTPTGSWDVDGYLFEKVDKSFSYVIRSVPKENGSSYIVIESNNLKSQLYNIDLTHPKTYQERQGHTYLLESYRMTVGRKKKEIDVANSFKTLGVATNEISVIDDSKPNWEKILTDILEWAILREKVKLDLKNKIVDIPSVVSPTIEFTMDKIPLNQILYGPPGTGKTYNTVLEAAKIITGNESLSYDEALHVFNSNLNNQIEFITFHQNYSYEDFIQGIRPDTENGKELSFEKKDGVFKRIADRALKNLTDAEKPESAKKDFDIVFQDFIIPLSENDDVEVKMKQTSFHITQVSEKSIEFRKNQGDSQHTLSINTLRKMYNDGVNEIILGGLQPYYNPILALLLEKGKSEFTAVERKNYVIIIDEINRANISRVFGELITLIEKDKRSHGKIPLRVTLPSGDPFIVPSNLYIIGTMNTADKSIALLDIALRRRFDFVPKYPNVNIDGVNHGETLTKINLAIKERKNHDFTIGHAYFMGEDYTLENTINNKVIPLLLEYFMNDDREVTAILKAAEITIGGWPLKMLS